MTTQPSTHDAVDERKSTILKVVVDSYISDPTPVASKTVTKRSGLDVSSATIRNEMHALEDAGYLSHTHRSSGRIPTDRGYRFFVDNYVHQDSRTTTTKKSDHLHDALCRSGESTPDRLLEQAVILLSSLTQHTAVIMKDSSKDARVSDVHLSRLDDGRIVVALFLDDSTIERAVLDLDDGFNVSDTSLSESIDTLRKHCGGQLLRDVLNNTSASNDIVGRVVEAFRREGNFSTPDATVHVAGVANIAKSDSTSLRDNAEISAQLLALIEQHMVLIDLIRNSVDETIGARIGSENVTHELSRHSMVLAPFLTESGESGAVGVIGPTRMDYSKVFAYLNSVSSTIPKFLDR